jgi:hypothetical protein
MAKGLFLESPDELPVESLLELSLADLHKCEIVRPEQQPARPARGRERQPRVKREQERVRPVARELFPPDGLAPDHVRTGEAIEAVQDKQQEKGHKISSSTTIKRVIGRAKEEE